MSEPGPWSEPDADGVRKRLLTGHDRTTLKRRRERLRDGPAAPPAPLTGMREVGGLIADARAAGAEVNATVLLEGLADISPSLGAAVHRMVQESLTNALKHAPGQPVEVAVRASAGAGVQVRVVNPLVPGRRPVVDGTGSGLLGMRERAALVGGTVQVRADQGWHVLEAHLPWSSSRGNAGPGGDEALPSSV